MAGVVSGMPAQARRSGGEPLTSAVARAAARWKPDVIQFEHDEIAHHVLWPRRSVGRPGARLP
jgi:hypothetical protein